MVRVFNLVFIAMFSVLISPASSHRTFGVRDVDHIKEHLPDTMNNLTNEDMLFHYFRSHGIEGNNELDDCELLQSLLHYHSVTSSNYGSKIRIFPDIELATLVDAVLDSDDRNMDCFIDYDEL